MRSGPMKSMARRAKKNGLLRAVKAHPVRTAAVAAGAVAGVALIRKAANTAAKVVTIRAVGNAAQDVAKGVQRVRGSKNGTTRGGKPRTRRKPGGRARRKS